MKFRAESFIAAPRERVFAFHELPDALQRLTPSWAGSRILRAPRSLREGERSVAKVRVAPLIWMRMELEHAAYDPPASFEDRQLRGPFRAWTHRHQCIAEGEGTRLVDEIELEPPFGVIGRAFAPLVILPRLRRLFAYRHEITRLWCTRP